MKKETKMNFIKLTQASGISLIVLIVTIIVIIILSAAVILTLSKNNPIESAREARFKEDILSMQDELSMYLSSQYTSNLGDFNPKTVDLSGKDMIEALPSTEGYENRIKVEKGRLKYIGDNEKEKEWAESILGSKVKAEWKATIADVTDDGVPIPKGFTYVTGTKTTGTVIKDGIGNEFVWVPATESTYVKDLDFPGVSPTGDDTLPIGVTDETYDVKKYGGFYIARYEAGVAESNNLGIPVSKKGAIVWSNIDYINAKASAEKMISNDYVQTGLLTGKAWDTTCHFIEDYIKTLPEESSLTNSMYYGNHINSTFKYINSSNKEVEKASWSNVKIPTGSTEYTKTKNIYDIAGNVTEWTVETCNSSRISRGGYCGETSTYYSVSSRDNYGTSDNYSILGFRARLYIK